MAWARINLQLLQLCLLQRRVGKSYKQLDWNSAQICCSFNNCREQSDWKWYVRLLMGRRKDEADAPEVPARHAQALHILQIRLISPTVALELLDTWRWAMRFWHACIKCSSFFILLGDPGDFSAIFSSSLFSFWTSHEPLVEQELPVTVVLHYHVHPSRCKNWWC